MGSLGRLLIGPRLGRIGLARLLVRVRVGRLHPIGRGILPGHGPGLLLAVSAVGKPVQAGETRLLVFHHTGDGNNAGDDGSQVYQSGEGAKSGGKEMEKVNINREQVHRIDEQLPQHYRNGGKPHGLQALPPSPFIPLGYQHKAENQGTQQGLV